MPLLIAGNSIESYTKAVNLSTKKTYWMQLYLPLLFLPLTLIHIFSYVKLEGTDRAILRFIADILFFNGIHVAFTFALLFILPQHRQWFRLASKQRHIPLGVSYIFIFLSIFFIYWNLSELSPAVAIVTNILIVLYALNHGVSQHMGISFLFYPPRNNQERKKERWVFKGILITALIEGFFRYTYNYSVHSLFPVGAFIGIILSTAAIFYLCIKSLLSNSDVKKEKFIFTLRLLFFPLSFWSYFARIGYAVAHGLEYFHISNLQLKQSQNPKDTGNLIGVLVGVALALIIIGCALVNRKFGLGVFFLNSEQPEPLWHKIVWTTFLSFNFLHYYIDGQIYRMRTKATQEYILPLLSQKVHGEL